MCPTPRSFASLRMLNGERVSGEIVGIVSSLEEVQVNRIPAFAGMVRDVGDMVTAFIFAVRSFQRTRN